MAPVAGSDLERVTWRTRRRSLGAVCARMGSGAHFNVPDQPLRSLWSASGLDAVPQPALLSDSLSDARALPDRASSDHDRLSDRFLGNTGNVPGAFAFCGRGDGVRSRRVTVGRTRSRSFPWR